MMATSRPHPRTIRDFSGFPRELYGVQSPTPAGPALAARIRDALAPLAGGLGEESGLDPGTLFALKEGQILIIGSGDLVHHLQACDWERPDAEVGTCSDIWTCRRQIL